jgi:hypothetical protein
MPHALSKEGSRALDSKLFKSGLRGSYPSTHKTDTVTPAARKSPLTKVESFSYPLKALEGSNILHQSKTNHLKGLSSPERDDVNLTSFNEG